MQGVLFCIAVLAAEPSWTQTQAVQADPDAVLRVLGDLESWPDLWSLGDAPRHVRGAAQSTRQSLVWSSGERGRARMYLLDIEPLAVRYAVVWEGATPLFGNIRPPGHAGTVRLEPSAGGTSVTWDVEPTDGARRLPRRLAPLVSDGLDTLERLAERPPAAPAPPAVVARDAVVTWRGFHHRWTYNHRINRSGDWWTVPECADGTCSAGQVHASASGTGADRATFDGFGSMLTGPGVRGWYGEVELWLHGAEGDVVTDRHCQALPDEVEPGPVLLRGYDLDAVESADSLWSVAVGIERGDGEVCAEASIKMACRTPECGSERLTTYVLRVPFVVATGPDLAAHTQSVVQHHSWQARDLRDEPDPDVHEVVVELPARAGRPAAVGLSAFSVELDAALHTRGLDIAVHPGAVDGEAMPVRLDLFYVQWGPVEMAPLTVAQFAHGGDATLSAEVVVLQPASGCVAEARTSGVLFWPGKQADASIPGAEHRAEATFDLECLDGP